MHNDDHDHDPWCTDDHDMWPGVTVAHGTTDDARPLKGHEHDTIHDHAWRNDLRQTAKNEMNAYHIVMMAQ